MITKKVVLGACTVAAVAVAVFVAPNMSSAKPQVTHPNAHAYQENPAPTMVGNAQLAQSSFLTQDKVIQMAHIPQDAKLNKASLTTWGQYVLDHLNGNSGLTEIAKDRMVWVVIVDYPNGVDTKGGFYANATQTITFDAQTGRIIGVSTTGDLQYTHRQTAPTK